MKKLLLAAALCSVTFGANAQDTLNDGRDVIAAAYEATGGDAWRAVSSMVTSNDISILTPQGELAGSGVMSIRFPGYMHAAMNLEFEDPSAPAVGEMTQVITPDTAYMQMAQGTQPLPKGTGPKFASRELELLEKVDATFELVVEDIDGVNTYVVTVTDEDEVVVVHYDTETLLRTKSIEMTRGVEVSSEYGNYKEVDGKLIPHRVKRSGGGQSQTIRTRSVEINKDVSAIFENM